MKKTVRILTLAVAGAIVSTSAALSCTQQKTSPAAAPVGELTTVKTIDPDYEYPFEEGHLEDTEIDIEYLSDAPDYLVLPDDIVRTAEVDSLVAFYNNLAAAYALIADSHMQQREFCTNDQMPEFDGSGVTDPAFRTVLAKLAKAVRAPYDPENDDEYFEEIDRCSEEFSKMISDNYADFINAWSDTTVIDRSTCENLYVSDIEKLKERVKTDSLAAKELRERFVAEKYFVPQTVLARQYALACYRQDDSIDNRKTATGLLQALLEADLYSPYLPELWRMWRARIQIDALSMSNYGEICNHLYNKMRNRVAVTLLREYIATHSPQAFDAFMALVAENNILRVGSFIGNYATLEDMELFWSPTRSDKP